VEVAKREPNPRHPVMIVDDEENQLTSMRIALRSAGYDNLRLVSDSRKVIDMLAQETFSLVILDLNMPHVTGHEIIRQSAALEDRPPLVIMTGSHSVEDYADGTSGGVVEYLVKPIDRERLITVVERSLSRPTQFSKSRLTRNYLLSDLITVGSWTPESSVSGGIMDMLEQSRREYRRLIADFPTPYVLLEEGSYRIRYCNNAFLKFLGIPSAEVVQQIRFFDLLDDEGRTRTIRALQETGELRDAELQGRTPEGRSFVIAGTFQLSKNDGLAECGFVEVTRAKQAEQELARAHKHDTVGRFAAGLAHDFSNMLLIVSGFAELIASEEGASPAAQEHAGRINRAVEGANKLVRQLLSMGRAPRETHVPVEINSALRDAEANLRQYLRAGQALHLSLAPGNLVVHMPDAQLEQVVGNLVLNARDAMPGGGTITIRTWAGDDPHLPGRRERVFLEIGDTGTGMDAQTLARIFEPFFTTKSARNGSGLGLSMVQMIIEAVGGRIDVESSPGSGTRFRIDLPSTPEIDPLGGSGAPDSRTGGAP